MGGSCLRGWAEKEAGLPVNNQPHVLVLEPSAGAFCFFCRACGFSRLFPDLPLPQLCSADVCVHASHPTRTHNMGSVPMCWTEQTSPCVCHVCCVQVPFHRAEAFSAPRATIGTLIAQFSGISRGFFFVFWRFSEKAHRSRANEHRRHGALPAAASAASLGANWAKGRREMRSESTFESGPLGRKPPTNSWPLRRVGVPVSVATS